MCTYKYLPTIRIDDNRCDACARCVEICPRNVLAKKNNKIVIVDLMACTLCRDCEASCPENPPIIKVEWDKNKFIFSLESTKALPPTRIIREAIQILDERLNDFESQIKMGKKIEES
jgi:DNA-directed RNA polymerase subunit D